MLGPVLSFRQFHSYNKSVQLFYELIYSQNSQLNVEKYKNIQRNSNIQFDIKIDIFIKI